MITDYEIASKYKAKVKACKSQGIEFNLSLMSYANTMRRKRCFYTGIKLTLAKEGRRMRGSDITLERIDNSKGYVKGNVVACSYSANQFKAIIENPTSPIDKKSIVKILKHIK